MISIGQNIRSLRIRHGITQEALAYHLNVTPQAISRWENMQSMPDITMLPAIAHFFEISIDELFSYDPDDTAAAVQEIQSAFYASMDNDPVAAEHILRDGLRRFPGNEALLVNLLYMLKPEVRYEEHISLCRRLVKSNKPEIRFTAACSLAKSYLTAGNYNLAKELLEDLPYFDRTKLEVQALLLSGKDSFDSAQREKNASLARLLDMLQCISLYYAKAEDYTNATTILKIAIDVLNAFHRDIPYCFPADTIPTQTYQRFQKELQIIEDRLAFLSSKQ